jgi:hypothetical protein
VLLCTKHGLVALSAASIQVCGVSVGVGGRAGTVRAIFAVVCVMSFRCGGCLFVS